MPSEIQLTHAVRGHDQLGLWTSMPCSGCVGMPRNRPEDPKPAEVRLEHVDTAYAAPRSSAACARRPDGFVRAPRPVIPSVRDAGAARCGMAKRATPDNLGAR